MGITDELIALLKDAGIHCCKAFPNQKMPVLKASAVVVGTKQMRISPCAIDNHFGTYGDEVCRVGLCEEEVFLHIYSPYLWGGQSCEAYTQQVLSVILSGVVSHTFQNIRREQSYYDPKTDCFRTEITATVLSWMRLTED